MLLKKTNELKTKNSYDIVEADFDYGSTDKIAKNLDELNEIFKQHLALMKDKTYFEY